MRGLPYARPPFNLRGLLMRSMCLSAGVPAIAAFGGLGYPPQNVILPRTDDISYSSAPSHLRDKIWSRSKVSY